MKIAAAAEQQQFSNTLNRARYSHSKKSEVTLQEGEA